MRKRLAIGLLAAAIILGLAAAKRHELLRFFIQEGASLATGYGVRVDDLHLAHDGFALDGVRVARGDRSLLDAKHIAIRFSLRDLLPGSRHRFGLTGVEIDEPKLTVTRFADGSFDFNLPRGGGAPAAPSRVNEVPLKFTLRVRDARIDLREPAAYDPSAKELRIAHVDLTGSVDTAAVTSYRAAGTFETDGGDRFTLAGRVDALRGYATHRAYAARFPLRALANYFADTPAVRILHATARNFDARVYALGVVPNVAPSYHVGLGLDVSDGRFALTSLAAPVERFQGHIELVDDAFFVHGARAKLAGIALTLDGGAYDFTGARTGTAELRLGVDGAGDLSALRQAFTFAKDQDISGSARFGVLVHGPIADPVIVARVNASRALYRAMPFDALAAGVVYHANTVALMPLRANYGGIDVGVRGLLLIGAHVQSQFALHVSGPASRLAYLDEMLGDEPIEIDAAATGRDLLFHVIGSAASANGVSRVAALVRMDPEGVAVVDPFWFHTERGDFDGAYLLDRPHDTSAFWLVGNNLRMRVPKSAAFPGVPLPQMPPIDARAVGMTLAGGGSGRATYLAGRMNGADTTIAGIRFYGVDAAFGGTLQHADMNLLRAAGPWGTFAGNGQFTSQKFVAYGAYRGTFEGLQPFLGSAIPGHGRLDGTVGVAIGQQRIVVVGNGLRMRNATLRGVPLTGASLTLAVEGNRLRLFSAKAHAAGGDVVAAGTFALGPSPAGSRPGALALVANRLQSAQLRGIGLPIDTGTLTATGSLAAGSPLPTFDGAVAIDRGRVAHFPVTGNGEVHLSGDAVSLRRIVTEFGGTYARVDGTIGSLSSGSPAYALDATVPAARVAPALRTFGIPNYMTDGSFNARLRIAGRSAQPDIFGSVGVPAGEVNGLPFVDATAQLAADPSGVSIDRGGVLVGTTATSFSAVVRPRENLVAVRAPHADLADFNNFFDTGDTLAGRGGVRLSAASQNGRITSSGNIDVRGFRYRNLPIGDTRAVWSSARNVIAGALRVGGNEGTLHARGTIALTPGDAWQATLAHSRFDLTADLDDLDLSLWMPALGMQSVPITGRASGDATLHGRYPQLSVRGTAEVTQGTLGPLSLDSARIAVHAAQRRMIIDSAELTTPEIAASATGSLGLGKNDPLDVRVHATTDRLARLVYDVSRIKVPISGSFESTLNIGGTYRAPTFLAGFDATDVRAYGIAIASLFGEVRLHRNALVLSNAGANFGRGDVTLAGSLPFSIAPLRLAAPDQPMNFDLQVVGLDPSIFDEALGNNTKLGGLIDGHVGLSGTIRQPAIVGRISLDRGSYSSALERVPITQIAAALAFDHTSASLERAAARLGNGTAQLSGRINFPSGFAGGASTLSFKGTTRAAQLDMPGFGSGTVDARLALDKAQRTAALLSGNVTLTNATLPFASFLKAAQGSGSVSVPQLPLAFDLNATVGRNVRVRGSGYGAGLDIGAAGSVHLGGTLAAPTLAGSFDSSGGTLTYFDRAFRVQQGGVTFSPADGVLPTIHAVATSSVVNPDPDRARNPYGSAEVTIAVDGQIPDLKIGLTSNPAGYSRDEILGLIAPFGGFVGGIPFNRQSMLARQSPGGITPLGALSPIPEVSLSQRSTITVGQEAFNILNAQFTAGLLAPFESTLGQGLGLSSVNLTLGYYGNVGFTATRLLGKAVSAVYAVTFGIPQIQSFGLMVQPNAVTTATLNFFYQSGPTKLLQLPNSPVGYNASYNLTEPLIGNSGFSLTFQRYFW